MKAATFFALAGAVIASPALERRSVDPVSAELAVLAVLPSSLAAEVTNTAELASDILAEFATGTPTWFSELPTDVQAYLVSEGTAAFAGTIPTASSNATGIYSNSSASTTSLHSSASAAASSTITSPATTAAGTGSGSTKTASSSTSTGGAAFPSQIAAGGLAGVVGLVAMLAL